MQERGWGGKAFLGRARSAVLEMSAGAAAAKVWGFGAFWLLQKGGGQPGSLHCCSVLPVRGLAGRGERPAQHVAHAGKGELGKPQHQGIKTFPLSTTTQGSGHSVFPLLAKLLEKRIRVTKARRLAPLQFVPMPGSAGLGACRTPAPETAAGRRDGACLSKSWLGEGQASKEEELGCSG